MSVDGVGKGGRVGGPSFEGPAQAASTAAADAELRLGTGGGAEQVPETSDLGRLARGEIDLGGYLDRRVGEAVEHLEGRLPPEDLELVKSELRLQLETDPVLRELLQQATGLASGGTQE